MRILIYGAGVIGSLYAALLSEAGEDVTIYARGSSLPGGYQGAGHLYRWRYRYGNRRIEEVIS